MDLALAVFDLHPVADTKRLLDLNREAGEQVAQGVLQGEAQYHRADRRRGEQLLAQQHGADRHEQRDHGGVLHDAREAIAWPIVAPLVGGQRYNGVDDRQHQDEPGQARQQLDIA